MSSGDEEGHESEEHETTNEYAENETLEGLDGEIAEAEAEVRPSFFFC